MSVLKPGGMLILSAPNKCNCFDRQRIVTSFKHFELEYNNKTLINYNNHEHKKEWAISHIMSEKWYDNNYKPNPLHHKNAVIATKDACDQGACHFHTWDTKSFEYFCNNIGRLLNIKIYLKQTYFGGLDMFGILIKN
jgi:hypothetical protein